MIEIFVVCKTLGYARWLHGQFIRWARNEITRVTKAPLGAHWRGIVDMRFISEDNVDRFLRGRRNYAIIYGEWLEQRMEDFDGSTQTQPDSDCCEERGAAAEET